MAEVLSILHSRGEHTSVAPRTPHGMKNNVYVVVDNTKNMVHCQEGLHNVFDDNCGAYDKRN